MLLPQKYAYREINFQLIYMQVPSAVILSEAICLYCVVETRRASVERSDLAAVEVRFWRFTGGASSSPTNYFRNFGVFVQAGGLLRFGHARGLTAHRAVIQHLRAATLPRLSVKFKQSHLRRGRLNTHTILSTLFLYPVGETPCFLLKSPLK